MNLSRRVFLNITRRKVKTLILLFITIILGTIMLSSLLVIQSANNVKEAMLKKFPPIVSLEFDFDKFYEMNNGERSDAIEYPWITLADLERIEETSRAYVKIWDYSTHCYIRTDSIKPYRTMPDEYYEGESQWLYFRLMGVSRPDFALLEMGQAKIIEGRTFTEEEIAKGSPVLIMSEKLARHNGFAVGDTIDIEIIFFDYSESEEAIADRLELSMELIGILEHAYLPEADDYEEEYMVQERNNTLFSSNRFVEECDYRMFVKGMQIFYKDNKEELEDAVSSYEHNPFAWDIPVTYILHSSEMFEEFVERAQAALDNEFYRFTTLEDNYKKVAAALESMKEILALAFYITAGSAIVVLALVLLNFIRERKKEIGIYLALGEKKSGIAALVIFETLAVGLVGAALSLAVSLFMSLFISDLFLGLAAVDPGEAISISDMYWLKDMAVIDYGSISQTYRVGFSPGAVILFFAVITVTVIVAQLIASVYILRSDPKKIMMQ